MKTSYLKLALFSLVLASSASAIAGSGSIKSNVGYLSGKASKTYTVRFYGYSPARVALRGVGHQDIDMYVYDQFGRLRCYDSSRSNKFTCRMFPRSTGRYTIKVVNRSYYPVEYAIATN